MRSKNLIWKFKLSMRTKQNKVRNWCHQPQPLLYLDATPCLPLAQEFWAFCRQWLERGPKSVSPWIVIWRGSCPDGALVIRWSWSGLDSLDRSAPIQGTFPHEERVCKGGFVGNENNCSADICYLMDKPQNITLHERRQSQKATQCMVPFIAGLARQAYSQKIGQWLCRAGDAVTRKWLLSTRFLWEGWWKYSKFRLWS